MEPRGRELVRRYKAYFNIAAGDQVAEERILAHWEMERELRRELLSSTPENRWETFERCYTRLYAGLDWLMPLVGAARPAPSPERFERWADLLGPPPKTVYEIGSGKGELIAYLASRGFTCKGAEVTRERGEKHVGGAMGGAGGTSENLSRNLTWGVSDGVHLDRFEPPGTYDAVVSDHVIEHLHPEDLAAHLSSARRILKPGGRYVFCTPHRHTGPHDITRVFENGEPRGTHLKEYAYRDLARAARAAGFEKVYFAFVPGALRRLLARVGMGRLARASHFSACYLRWLLFVEGALTLIPRGAHRRRAALVMRRLYMFADNICLVAEKGEPE